MNGFIENNKTENNVSVIKKISIAALICLVVASSTNFIYYRNSKLAFQFPSAKNLFLLILALAPFVLLIVYLYKFHDIKAESGKTATILISSVFGLRAIRILLSFLGASGFGGLTILTLIFSAAACIAGMIFALKGFKNKIFIIIAMSVCVLFSAISFISMFSTIRYLLQARLYFFIVTNITSIAAYVLFYFALFFYGWKNEIPVIIGSSEKGEAEHFSSGQTVKNSSERVANLTPEQSLKLLKDKLDLGIITAEEYQEKRKEIIDSL